jgi:hypothetical protein
MHNLSFTMSEHEAVSVRLALRRALHTVEKILADYSKLDENLFFAIVQHYQQERDNTRAALDAINLQYYSQIEAQGTLEQAAWYDTSAELQ